jgi:hypothetical protein
LPEHADTFGQDDAVEAVLQIIVIAANVKLAERILGDIRCLQDHLVEQRVVAAGRGGDGRVIDGVGGGAGLGLNAGALLVEQFRGHHHRRQCGIAGPARGIDIGAVGRVHDGREQRAGDCGGQS